MLANKIDIPELSKEATPFMGAVKADCAGIGNGWWYANKCTTTDLYWRIAKEVGIKGKGYYVLPDYNLLMRIEEPCYGIRWFYFYGWGLEMHKELLTERAK